MSVIESIGPAPGTTANVAVNQVLRAKRRQAVQQVALGVGFPLLLLAVWESCARTGVIDQRFFPSPSRIVAVAIDVVSSPTEAHLVVRDVLATLGRAVWGYMLGAVLGVIVGAVMGLYRPIRDAIAPTIYATFPTPKLAIFPLLIVIFGLGDASKTALVTFGVFFMVCINTLSGVLYANPIYRDFARAFRLPLHVQWFRVIVPSALPSIMAGLKLGIGQAFILVVSAEFVSANDGIGYYIWNSWQILDISRMFVGLLIVSMLGGAAVVLSNTVERYLIPWAKRS
jgi:ABC-type nitrate/sulfonate/bicarbonate transport system permease component